MTIIHVHQYDPITSPLPFCTPIENNSRVLSPKLPIWQLLESARLPDNDVPYDKYDSTSVITTAWHFMKMSKLLSSLLATVISYVQLGIIIPLRRPDVQYLTNCELLI